MSRRLDVLLVVAAVVAAGCAPVMKAAGFPPEATRPTPPSALEQSALKVGDKAPDVRVMTSSGEPWSLENALTSGPAVIVFYRGHW